MTQNLDGHEETRQYLLGMLDDRVKMRQIEENLLLDDEFADELSMAEDELIESYIDDELSADDRERFESYFLVTTERKQKVRLARGLREYVTRLAPAAAAAAAGKAEDTKGFFDWRQYFSMPVLRFATILLVVAGLGYGVWRVGFYQSDVDKGLARLQSAYKGSRPLDSRIVGFDYAAMPQLRGPGSKEKVSSTERDSAAAILSNAVSDNRSADSLYALGKVYLANKELDKALECFEQAVELNPRDARIRSDLGAAYLEKGKGTLNENSKTGLELLEKALKNLEKAIELDQKMKEPRFNRAICLEALVLPDQAKKAWNEYIEIDPGSEWADEARRRLKDLEEKPLTMKSGDQVLQDFFLAFDQHDEARAWQIVSQTKEMNTGVMVAPLVAQAMLVTDDTPRHISALRLIGDLETKHSGDAYFRELAEYYASLDDTKREDLRQAQAFVRDAYAAYAGSNCKDAVEKFTAAKDLFEKSSDVWEARVAGFWTGVCSSRGGNLAETNRSLLAINEYAAGRNWNWLQVQILNLLSNNSFNENEFSAALRYNEQALEKAVAISDTYNQQRVLASQAYIYRVLQNYDKSLEYFGRLQKMDGLYYTSPRQAWRNHYVNATILYGLKDLTSAVAVGNEAAALVSANLSSPSIINDSRRLLSTLLGGAGHYAEGLKVIDTAIDDIRARQTDPARASVEGHLFLLQKSHILRQSGDYRAAIDSYKDLLSLYSGPGFADITVYKYEAHKGLLLCYTALSMHDAIEEELPVTLELSEKNRSRITSEKNRNTFFDNEQDLYDIAIRHAYSRGETVRAFDYSEQSRARSLLDSISGKAGSDKDGGIEFSELTSVHGLADLQARVPRNVQVLQYALLPDEVLLWVVTPTGVQTAKTSVPAGDLRSMVLRYRGLVTDDLEAGRDETNALARDLYDTLVRPALPFLDPDKEICLIPDKSLNYLPFNSLIDRGSGRYLIEDFELLSAPSLSVFLLSTEAAGRPLGEDRLLGVGNPRIDRSAYNELKDLPDAGKEIGEIGSFYRSPRILTGTAAGKNEVLASFPKSNVFHFAGHYVIDERFPMHSRLLLANTGETGGDLEVGDVLKQQLRSTKLAVLAACSTGTEGYFNGEGMFGAARAFLSRGVPLVIASQWAVDSPSTAKMMVEFHRLRTQQKISSVASLRQAQLGMIHGPDRKLNSPFYWAGFMAIGGNAAY